MLPEVLSFFVLLGCTYAITNIACEGDTLPLYCPGGRSINVTYANYGRTNLFTCRAGGSQNDNCVNPNSLPIVRRACQNQNRCSISASDFVFGDPCPDTYKYLEVDYECETPESNPGNRFYVCEGGSLYLYCPRGYNIVVFSANYGRQHSEICPGPGSDRICRTPGSVDIVRRSCQDRPQCQLEASSAVFGDPCPGVSKYLEVNIGCRPIRL